MPVKTKPVVKPETRPAPGPQREPGFSPDKFCPAQIEKCAP